MRWCLCLLFLCCLALGGHAQSRTLTYGLTSHVAGADSDGLPFWLAANRYGTLDPRGENVAARLSSHLPFAQTDQLDFALGIDILGRASDRSTVLLQQLYASLKYRPFILTVGRQEEYLGLSDPNLSMGTMTFSSNATPVPKVGITLTEVPLFNIPSTQYLIKTTGMFAHGWLEADRFVEDAFLHEKYFYLKGKGPKSFPVDTHAGIVHHVVWGGTHPERGPLPSSFEDFIRVALAQSGEAGSALPGEINETLGNNIAMYDVGLSIRMPVWEIGAYRQFYLETSAGLLFRNAWDGLWGVFLRRAEPGLVTGVLWEHVYTKRQGSRRGNEEQNDSYYNNGLYRGGWVYHGRTRGLPLLFSDGVNPGVANNYLIAHHFAVAGQFGQRASYRMFVTYSRNYGAVDAITPGCDLPPELLCPRQDQYSMLLETTGTISNQYGLSFVAALAVDTGDLYENRIGGMLGLSWSGQFPLNRMASASR